MEPTIIAVIVVLAILTVIKITRKQKDNPVSVCMHDWQVVENAENTGKNFPDYAAGEIKKQLWEDFKDLLAPGEFALPSGRNIKNPDDYLGEYRDQKLYPQIYVCLKCMRYKSDLDGSMGNRIKQIYSDYYKQNLSRFITKSKKIKLTLTGVSEIREGANQLDSLNVIMKEFGQLHTKEKELLAKMRLI